MKNKLKNCFLIASPGMEDAVFSQTVILLLEHRAEGAFGLVINREGDFSLSDACEQMGCPEPKQDVMFGWGGPVHPMMAFVLHSLQEQWKAADFQDSETGIAMATSGDVLREIAKRETIERIYPVLGCAMWDAGQLEEEIRSGLWFSAKAQSRIVFDVPLHERYEAALALVGNDLFTDGHIIVSEEIGHA